MPFTLCCGEKTDNQDKKEIPQSEDEANSTLEKQNYDGFIRTLVQIIRKYGNNILN